MFMLFQRLTSRGKIYWGSNEKSLLGSGVQAVRQASRNFLSTSVVVQRQARFGKEKINLLIATLANLVCLATIFCGIGFIFRLQVGGSMSSPWRYENIMLILSWKTNSKSALFGGNFCGNFSLFFPARFGSLHGVIWFFRASPRRREHIFPVNSALMVDSRVGSAGCTVELWESLEQIFSHCLTKKNHFYRKLGRRDERISLNLREKAIVLA